MNLTEAFAVIDSVTNTNNPYSIIDQFDAWFAWAWKRQDVRQNTATIRQWFTQDHYPKLPSPRFGGAA